MGCFGLGSRLPNVRGLVTATALALTVLGVPSAGAQELKPLEVLIYPGLINQQNVRAALGAGIFERNGLNVTLVQVESGPAGMAAVQGGSIDIGAADANLPLLANAKGSDYQIVCGASGLYFAVIAGPNMASVDVDAAYPNVMKAFVGKNLGVTGLGSSTHFFWQLLFKDAGLDPNSASYVPVGLAASAVQALRTNRIDAYMGFEPVIAIANSGAMTSRVPIDLRPPKSDGPAVLRKLVPQLIWYAKRDFLEKQPDLAKAFNRSLVEAAQWQQDPANLNQLIEIMRPTVSVGDSANAEADLRRMIADNIPVTSITGVSREAIAAWVDLAKTYSGYPQEPDPTEVADKTIWADACK